MKPITQTPPDRVRTATPDKVNEQIDQEIREHIEYYATQDEAAINARLRELDKEWDIERALELNAALVALTGVALSAMVNKKWLILPAIVTAFLAQHALQGWCPPLPLFRRLGVRTQKEIEKERYALLRLKKTSY